MVQNYEEQGRVGGVARYVVPHASAARLCRRQVPERRWEACAMACIRAVRHSVERPGWLEGDDGLARCAEEAQRAGDHAHVRVNEQHALR